MNNNRRFGGALDAALERVIESPAPSISVADAGTREAFLDAWIRTLTDHARFLRSNKVSLAAPVVVAYVPDTGEFGKYSGWDRRAMFGASQSDNYAGILAAGTAEIGACIYPTSLKDTSEFEKAIKNTGLQASPTIALVSASELLIWANGIESACAPFKCSLDDGAVVVNLEAIDAVLNRFYEEVARQNKTWWKDTDLRTTVEQPEATVQHDLWLFLLGMFSQFALIKPELVSGSGRADIIVLPFQGNAQNQSAVLELKTLRDVRTPQKDTTTPSKIPPQENINWACSGVQQAAAYRDQEKLDCAFLCLYDFCAGNSTAVDDAVAPHAVLYSVTSRRYWISASHKEHRADRYPLEEA